MLANEILPFLAQYWPLVTVSVLAAFLLNNKYWKGLNRYPGPWAAGYSNWWRLLDVRKRNHHWTNLTLHRKYGDVVRLGPNVLSFADPRAIKAIYGLNKGVYKVSYRERYQSYSERQLISPVRLLPSPRRCFERKSTPLTLLYYR
jgi:hypothetical protein